MTSQEEAERVIRELTGEYKYDLNQWPSHPILTLYQAGRERI